MQYKSQESAMQAKSLDGQGKSHPHAPEYGTYGAGTLPSTPMANATAAGTLAKVTAAKRSIVEMSDAVVARARKSAGAANTYVREQPWQMIGVGAVAGLVLGLLLARRR